MTGGPGPTDSSLPLPLPLAPQARERAIEELSARFANDELTLDELERRLERVYRVRTSGELDALLADLRAQNTAVARAADVRRPAALDPDHLAPPAVSPTRASPLPAGTERVVSIMSSTRRRGAWRTPQRLEILAVMSETTLDLTQAVLPDDDVEIHVSALMAAVKIIVPRGMPVIMQVTAFMGSAHNRCDSMPVARGYPTIHVTGTAVMGEVKVVARDRR
jgi:hypothetical protein